MVKHFTKLYPVIKLDVDVSYDVEKMKEYVEIEY